MLLGVGLQAAAWSMPMFIGARYCSKCSGLLSPHLGLINVSQLASVSVSAKMRLPYFSLNCRIRLRWLSKNDRDICGLTSFLSFLARQAHRHF